MARYPFMTRNDGTEITFSKVKQINNVDCVTVCFERWSDEHDDFDSMDITFPNGIMENVIGFSEEEVEFYTRLANNYEPLFFKFAKQGGIGNQVNEI